MLELTLTPEYTSETVRGAGGWTMASPTAARGHARHPRPALWEGSNLNRRPVRRQCNLQSGI
jgi:hypothetical protein